ncbi:MAG: sugar-transfer associated ATP-grasp domain-containing protein [Pseudomonadota bacterium]
MGIDLSRGTNLPAVYRNDIISEHPDTGTPVAGLKIPGWEGLLELAARCYELTGLGGIRVSILCLTKERGR